MTSKSAQPMPRLSTWAAGCRALRFWFYTLLVVALVGLATFAIVADRMEPGRGEPLPLYFTNAPHPATSPSHP